jgi:hypothetical protein
MGMLTIVIAIVVSILIFLVLREFFCWYFKINEHLKKQGEIIEALVKGTGELVKEIRAINVVLQSGMDQNKEQNPEHKIDINI